METTPESASPQRRRRRGRPDRTRRADRDHKDRDADYRPTQLPFTTAARAREVATPSAADLQAASDDLVMVYRGYVPPHQLPQ